MKRCAPAGTAAYLAKPYLFLARSYAAATWRLWSVGLSFTILTMALPKASPMWKNVSARPR